MKDLLLESTIIQGIVTLILVLATTYLSIIGSPIPAELSQALFAVIGFWFGSKTRQATSTYLTTKELRNGR